MDNKQQNLNYLKDCLPHLTVSVIEPVLNSMQGDVDKALDELLNFNITGEENQQNSPPQNDVPVVDLQKAMEEERLFFQQLEQAKQKKAEEARRLEQIKREEEERVLREKLQSIEREKILQEKLLIEQKIQEERRRQQEAEDKARSDREQLLQYKEILKKEEEKKRNEDLLEKQRLVLLKEIEEQKLKLEEERRLFAEERQKEEELRKNFEEKQQLIEKIKLEKIKEEEEQKRQEEIRRQVEEEIRIKREEEEARIKEQERIERERDAAVDARVNTLMSKLDNNNLTQEQIEEKKLLFKSTLSKVDPVVYIYFRQAQQNIENSDEQASNLKQIFIALNVNPLAIRVSDISSDYELASFLKSCYRDENIVYPFVSIHGKPVGNYHKIVELNKNGTLRQYIDTPDSIVDLTREGASFIGQNVFDHCLDAAEYVISGVSTILWLPITILTWPFSGGKSQLSKQPMDVDIPVVHTNWYWRGLKRIFRFSNDRIIRIHPSHMDVRASHLYSSVDAIYIIDPNNIKIQYDSQGADYLTAEASDIQLIKEIITRKNTKVLVFDE